jgi:hypothetical protein
METDNSTTLDADTAEDRPVPLDDYAQRQYAAYLEAVRERREAQERERKARDAVIMHLQLHMANVGTVDDEPVVRLLTSHPETIDVERLRTEEPFLAQRFARTGETHRLYPIGGAR